MHRDIKPDNIIRGEDGRLFLVDFGAVRDFSTTMGGSSTVVGTYGYMAPEQFRGQAVPASDIYAVAATLLHLMTGRSPHELPQAKLKVVFRPHVQAPPALLAWLDRALEPSPEDRFATAAEALHALRHGPAPIANATTNANARPKASRARVGVLVGLLVAIVGTASVLVIRDVRRSRAHGSPLAAAVSTAPLPTLPTRPIGPYRPLRYDRTLPGHMSLVLGLALSPDAKTLATAGDGSVKLWDAVSGDALRTLPGHIGKVAGVTFTKDGKQLVTGDSSSIRVWEVSSGTQLRTIDHPHGAHVMDLVLSLDGKTLYTCSREGVAKAWDLESGRELHAYAHGAPIYTLALAPNGVHLVTGSTDGTLQLWNADSGTRIGAWPAHQPRTTVNAIAFSPDGSTLVSAGDDHLAKVAALASRGTVTPHYAVEFGDEAWGARFTPDGRFLVSASKDRSIRVNEALDGALIETLDAKTAAARMVFSQDSRSMFLAAGTYVQRYSLTYRGSGTKLPEPTANASDQLPRAKNRAHGLYLEAMSLMLRWPAASLDEAASKLDEGVAADARSPFPWVGRAQLAIKRGYRGSVNYAPEAIEEAKKHLDRAAALGPKGAEYWSVMAWVARSAQDLAGMKAAIREAYAVVPNEPYAALADVDLANREKRPEAAIEIASRVVRSTKRVDLLSWAHQLLGDSYTALGDIDAADAALRKQIELAPQNPWKHENYAHFLLHSVGDVQRAIEEAEKSLAMSADNWSTRSTLATARLERGIRTLWQIRDPDRARPDFDAAIAFSTEWPEPYYARAAAWRALAVARHDPSLVAKARADLKAALAASPKYALAQQALNDLDRVTAAAKPK